MRSPLPPARCPCSCRCSASEAPRPSSSWPSFGAGKRILYQAICGRGAGTRGTAAAIPTLFRHGFTGTRQAMLTTVLIVILILALIGSLPTWGYSRGWGYGPGGGIGILLIILIVLALTGRV